MMGKKTAKETMTSTVVANDYSKARKGRLKQIGGSRSDDWNNMLANQTVQALWLKRREVDAQHARLLPLRRPATHRNTSTISPGSRSRPVSRSAAVSSSPSWR